MRDLTARVLQAGWLEDKFERFCASAFIWSDRSWSFFFAAAKSISSWLRCAILALVSMENESSLVGCGMDIASVLNVCDQRSCEKVVECSAG